MINPHPYYDADYYRVIILGNLISPGVVFLSGHNRYKNWEIQKSRGSDGAVTLRGPDPPGQFEARFELSDEDPLPTGDLARWELFRALIESTVATPVPIALPIYHPDLAANGFTEVTSGGIGGAIHSGRGKVIYPVKFIEYKPPKPKLIRPPAPAGGGGGGGADPLAAKKAELAALIAESEAVNVAEAGL